MILRLADAIKTGSQNHIQGRMDAIIRNGKNLLQLVDQMLDLSKLESGKLLVNKMHANIIPFLKYIFQLQEFYAEEKRINMSFYSNSQSYEQDFDPEKTAAIIGNLLNNAIKFNGEGGYVQMKVYMRSGFLFIDVCDNGVGIPTDKAERIFDRFYQVDGKNTRREGGAGIGLSLTRELVNLLSGSVKVESVPGIETIFSVRLPVAHHHKNQEIRINGQAVNVQTEKGVVAAVEREIQNSGRKQLLIVENNSDVVDYLKICFPKHFNMIVAKDGLEGNKRALDEIPDIIISDVMMPGMDGFELCKKLKDDYRTSHMPV